MGSFSLPIKELKAGKMCYQKSWGVPEESSMIPGKTPKEANCKSYKQPAREAENGQEKKLSHAA